MLMRSSRIALLLHRLIPQHRRLRVSTRESSLMVSTLLGSPQGWSSSRKEAEETP